MENDKSILKRIRDLESEVNSLQSHNKRLKIVNTSLVNTIQNITNKEETYKMRIAELNKKIGKLEKEVSDGDK